MKKILIVFFSSFLVASVLAQSIDRSVIGAAGEVATAQKLTLDWTLGELAVNSYTYPKGKVTEGFHQPFITVSPLSPETEIVHNVDHRFSVFPNPTSAKVQMRAQLEADEEARMQLFDALGRQILPVIKVNGWIDQSLDLETFLPGTYLLLIRNHQDQVIHAARILKH